MNIKLRIKSKLKLPIWVNAIFITNTKLWNKKDLYLVTFKILKNRTYSLFTNDFFVFKNDIFTINKYLTDKNKH